MVAEGGRRRGEVIFPLLSIVYALSQEVSRFSELLWSADAPLSSRNADKSCNSVASRFIGREPTGGTLLKRRQIAYLEEIDVV